MVTIVSRLADLLSDVMMSSAGVTRVEALSTEVIKVELKCEAFRNVNWTPGAKLQFRPTRGAFQYRTYTPILWDSEEGRTAMIGYVHGHGPAADWFRHVSVGDVCEVTGPRGSIDLSEINGEAVFVGDESSLGLASALQTRGAQAHYLFEATTPLALAPVLGGLGLPPQRCTVVTKESDRKTLLQAASDAAQSCTGAFDLIVSGDAATVHNVRRAARDWPVKPRKVRGKAYWAPGRTGLE